MSDTTSSLTQRRWVEGAIVYQIYPRSLQDSNGDGIGDIPGIISRLDYLQELGVNAIWLSPFYPSPMADFGYDVADYCDVDPMFGTLDDFKRLLAEAEQRNIKVIVDLVPNHSSDQHVWFQQSRASQDNDYANWYIWKDPKGYDQAGKPLPPNNWLDVFAGQSAWQWEPLRQQFYLHSFAVQQPDLNWSNPAVRDAIKNVMRFWLDLGVDGFRVDAVYFMAKDPEFRDDPKNPRYNPKTDPPTAATIPKNSHGWPHVYAYLAEMAHVLKNEKYAPKDRFMVTEAYPNRHKPIADYMAFYEGIDPTVAAPFNFEGVSLPWEAAAWRDFLRDFHSTLDEFSPLCVASYAFGNHDQSRLVSRLGEAQARSAAVMLLTLPGMAFIYNGEEIGMHDVHIPAERVHDPAAKGDDASQGRDPERTPMQWSSAPHAGFTTADDSWLPVADDYKTHNVEVQGTQPDSFLSLYRRLCALRNNSEALKYGKITVLDSGNPDVLMYTRTSQQGSYLIVINFSNQTVEVPAEALKGKIILSTHLDNLSSDASSLRPHEGIIVEAS